MRLSLSRWNEFHTGHVHTLVRFDVDMSLSLVLTGRAPPTTFGVSVEKKATLKDIIDAARELPGMESIVHFVPVFLARTSFGQV